MGGALKHKLCKGELEKSLSSLFSQFQTMYLESPKLQGISRQGNEEETQRQEQVRAFSTLQNTQ